MQIFYFKTNFLTKVTNLKYSRHRIPLFFIMFFTSIAQPCYSEDSMFWWQAREGINFGDDLSRVIVERMLGYSVRHKPLESKEKLLLAAGSILHFAKDGDVIWGSGFRENPLLENRFSHLDVRAVRGPRTREFLLKMGIDCPEVYGDPAVLMGYLFPEFKKEEPIYDYVIIPNIGEINCFTNYKNIVLPTLPWNEIIKKMMQSRLVISSSLHGIIVAESFGVPARLLKMTWIEPLLKYQDYYESTGRPNFHHATSVQEALQMGGEEPSRIDINPLIESFPWDYFEGNK
jgi:pyruvyltransferase